MCKFEYVHLYVLYFVESRNHIFKYYNHDNYCLKDNDLQRKISELLSTDPEHAITREVNELSDNIERKMPDVHKKLKQMQEFLDNKFPIESRPFERGVVITSFWTVMNAPLTLYALNMTSLAIVELHGSLERLFIGSTVRQIAIPEKSEHVEKLLERKTLLDLSETLFNLDILDEEDLKFLKQLNRLRNGISHKNSEIISKFFLGGKELSTDDIDEAVNSIDIRQFIVHSLEIIIKLIRKIDPKEIKEFLQDLHDDKLLSKEHLDLLTDVNEYFGNSSDKS